MTLAAMQLPELDITLSLYLSSSGTPTLYSRRNAAGCRDSASVAGGRDWRGLRHPYHCRQWPRVDPSTDKSAGQRGRH